MMSDLTAGIVRILDSRDQTVGTGFVLTDDGFVVTCAHVVDSAGSGPGDTVRFVFHCTGEEAVAIVDPVYWRDPQAEDVAILRLETHLPNSVTPLPLGNSTNATGQTFHTFGFPEAKPVEGMVGKCEVVGWTTESGFPVLQLRSSETTLGFSGAPIWDNQQHVVIGMFVSIVRPDSNERMSETAFVIPIETLRKVCPELLLTDICPYRGLEVFEADHLHYYFGRETATRELLNLLSRLDFVAVVGVSGSGKSSLVRAGLAKGLQTWSIPGLTERLRCVFNPGSTPLLNLVLALATLSPRNTKRLAKSFNIQTSALIKERAARHKANDALNVQPPRTLAAALQKLYQSQGLLLIVDQFERLYTECQDEIIRNQFIDTLLLAAGENIKVILTLRADFYAQALAHTGLAQVIKENQMTLLPMDEGELRQVIIEPAKTLRRSFQPGLAERLIVDVRGRAGDLPLLEFALMELWELDAESGVLTLASYEGLGYEAPDGKRFPGLQGAIAQRAEQVWQRLSEADKVVAKRIFLGLITPGNVDERGKQIVENSSRRAWQAELDERAQQVAERLVSSRLVTTGKDPLSEQATVEVAHEALLRAWPRLQQWLVDYQPFLHWYNRELTPFLHRWLDQKQHSDFLLPLASLNQAQYWLQQYPDELSGSPVKYIQASHEKQELERIALERRRRRITWTAVGAAIIFLFLAIIALMQWNEAERQRFEAEVARATSEARREEADQQRQLAVARQLAAQSQVMLDNSGSGLIRSTLLAIESLRLSHTLEGDQVIRQGLDLLSRSVARMPHEDAVVDTAFSRDGRWVATGSLDGTTRVWETASGHELIRVNQEAPVEAIALSPDDRWLATGGGKAIKVWNVATGKELTRGVHSSSVKTIAFSPNGKWLASGTLDGTVKLWHTSTSQEVTIVGHHDEVWAVTFSPNSRWLATGSWDGSTKIWEVTTGKLVAFLSHEKGVLTVAFSPDSNWLATGSLDGIARVWEVPTGKEITRMAHYGQVETVAFSPDSTWLATGAGGYDNSARVWEVATGKELARMNHDGSVQSLAFSADGKCLATGSLDNTARIWNAATGEETARMVHKGLRQVSLIRNVGPLSPLQFGSNLRISPEGGVSDVAFSRDGKWLATGSYDNTAQVWEVTANQEIANFGHEEAVRDIEFSPDSRWLITKSGVYTDILPDERLWEVVSGKEISLLPYGYSGGNITFSPDGKYLATEMGINTVHIWDTALKKDMFEIVLDDTVRVISFSPDGKWLATGSWDNTISIWNIATRDEVSRILSKGEVWNIEFSSDNRWVIVRGGYSRDVQIWETTSGQKIAQLDHSEQLRVAAVSSDGKWLVTTSSGYVRVWETATGREISQIEFKNSLETVIFSPDGKWLLIKSPSWEDDTSSIWETATGREVTQIEIEKHQGSSSFYVNPIFSSSSQWLAIKNWDSVLLWEASTGRKVAHLVHENEVSDIAFSPDSKWLATGSADNTIRIWEAASGQEVARMEHRNDVMDIAFSPDGKWLASGGYDRTARVWWLWPQDLIAEACARLPRNLTQIEWERFFPNEPYQPTCPNLPIFLEE